MTTTSKIKSVDFYRKIPRDLTEASLSGAGFSLLAAFSIIFLFGMELSNYLTVSTSTSIVTDESSDGDFLRIEFNISFPSMSCEFASVDVSDVLGTNRLNITKTISKYSIDHNLIRTGNEFHSGPVSHAVKHGDDAEEEIGDGSVTLNGLSFDKFAHHYSILVVNFYAPWCYWSNRLKPSWEKAARIIRERFDPDYDDRIILAKVDCTDAVDLCKRNHIQGYPSIRIFRKGSDVRGEHGHHDHESYYGDRDTDSLVATMENLVGSVQKETSHLVLGNGTGGDTKRPAPAGSGCRIEGFVRVKKVPGDMVISARSQSHSFDTSLMNMSHVVSHFSFGRHISPKVLKDVKRLMPTFGASVDRLNGRSYINSRDISANVTIEHYLQVVRTEVRSSNSKKLAEEYEYTAHSSLARTLYIPVAKFHFELSPMQVLITENAKAFSHFITNVCAIIGGIFTVAGIVDSVFHNTMRVLKKVELGKNF